MIVTNHERLGNYTANCPMSIDGTHAPYGYAGFIFGDCTVVCPECFDGDVSDRDPIFGNSEWDYPGATCDRCCEYLDVDLIVCENQDPRLHYRLRMSDNFGEYQTVLSIREISDIARQEAYEMGYAHAMPDSGEISYQEISQGLEHFKEGAKWANTIAPKLRATAGAKDPTGKGTYTDWPIDAARRVYDSDVIEGFSEGWVRAFEESEHVEVIEE